RAVVTDLGCAFTLTVDAQGRGRLVVTEGRVAIAEGPAAEIVVAAGGSADFALPPTVPQPNAPVPTQKPAPKQPMPKHSTPKPGKASPHAPPAAPQPATQRPPAPATPRPPAKVPPPADPGVKLKHDAFKDLDSVR
ncbi:MAG TPA: hypothetical protein VMZ28_06385, partial [Kofleriaceae bacterium]|nr:hypothetical protein [Kofleriaceae bacterium]